VPLLWVSALGLLCLFCGRADNYHPRLKEYLIAERRLRMDITEEQGLEDSLRVLKKRFKLDIDKELAALENKPLAWLRMIKDLKGGK
jgi:hypothetical protein